MSASVKINRKMTRKDGKAKGTVKSSVKVSTSPNKAKVSVSRKIVPNVKSVKGN